MSRIGKDVIDQSYHTTDIRNIPPEERAKIELLAKTLRDLVNRERTIRKQKNEVRAKLQALVNKYHISVRY